MLDHVLDGRLRRKRVEGQPADVRPLRSNVFVEIHEHQRVEAQTLGEHLIQAKRRLGKGADTCHGSQNMGFDVIA